MRRRYKALLAIAIPTAIIYGLKVTHAASYEWLMGYMFAIALVFKASILSLWFASKLKLIAFVKGLTVFQGLVLLLKRWFLDNVLTQWLKTNIIDHLVDGFKEAKDYYIRLNLKAKLKNAFSILLGLLFLGFIAHYIGYLDKILIFAEVKMIASAVFEGILTFATKIHLFCTLMVCRFMVGSYFRSFCTLLPTYTFRKMVWREQSSLTIFQLHRGQA